MTSGVETVSKTIEISRDLLHTNERLIGIFSTNGLVGPFRNKFLSHMQNIYPEAQSLTERVFNYIEQAVDEEPESIIQLGRALISKFDNINQIMTNYTSEEKSIRTHLLFIKVYWESYELLKPAVIFATNNNESIVDQRSTYKHLIKKFGFKKTDLEVIRLVRNCDAHGFKILKDEIIIEETNSGDIKTIKISDLESIRMNMENIFNWWFNAFVNLIWSQPKFGLLILIGFIPVGKNGGFSDIKEKIKTLERMNPHLKKPKSKKKRKLKSRDERDRLLSDKYSKEIKALKLDEFNELFDIQIESLGRLFFNQLVGIESYLSSIKDGVSNDSRVTVDFINDYIKELHNGKQLNNDALDMLKSGGDLIRKGRKFLELFG